MAWVCALAFGLGVAHAADAPRLTLEAVLALADAPHPDLDMARAQADAALAETRLAESLDDLQVSLEGALRTGHNSLYDSRFKPDHQGRLLARKPLYDGGFTEASAAAARAEAEARAAQLMDARAQRRLTLMARYFDVLLADMRYNADTEFLAVAYVVWDNAKDRAALGQMPQWQLAELEANYQDATVRRNETRRLLRDKRMQLASAMNRTMPVQEELSDPRLADNERALPELEVLVTHALAHNPGLLAQERSLAAARQRREAVRAGYRPALTFEAEAAAWSRESTTRDDLRAGLSFSLPLWQGDRQDAALAREQARIAELQARQEKLAQQLRESLAATWEEVQLLRGTLRQAAQTTAVYRELALEKARAEYELELKTNLGTSMAETQVAQLQRRAVEYRLALALARLEALLGTPLAEIKAKDPS